MDPSVDPLAPHDPLQLNSEEWRAILPKLTRHARKRLRDGCLERARDLAQDAVAQACERRLAIGDAEPVYVLCGLVNGLAMNERRRWRHTREIAVDDETLTSFGGGVTPEDALIAREEHAATVASLRSRFARDAMAAQIVELFARRIFDAAEQKAAAPGMSIEAVRNGRRRVLGFLRSRGRHEQA